MRVIRLAMLGCAGCVADADSRPARLEPTVEVQTFDPAGRPTDGTGLAMRVWGPGSGAPAVGQAGGQEGQGQGQGQPPPTGAGVQPQGEGQGQDEAVKRRDRDAALRNQFGSAVVIAPDGTVTKQYFLSGEATTVFQNLLREPSAAPEAVPPLVGFDLDRRSESVLARMLGDHHVKITLFRDFEPIEAMDIRSEVKGAVPVTVGTGPKNSLLLVAAQPTALAAFEDALNLFFSHVPQIELEVKVIEFTTTDAVAFGVRPVDADTPLLANLKSDRLIRDITSSFPLRQPSVAGSATDRGLLTIGGVHDGWELAARLEALEINQLVDVVSQPKLTVRNGGLASVSTVTKVPYPKAKFTSSGSNVVADIDFLPIGITLHIRPVIAGTDTVILQIFAKVSAVTGFTGNEPVPIPTFAEREVVTQVHVHKGQATTISGLLGTNTFDHVSKVPLLGDIPILGYLFRSTTRQKTKQNVEFIITPRIRIGPERADDLDVLNPIGR